MNRFFRNRLRATRSESGFTLVELIMTVSILGILLGGISAILITSLKAQASDSKTLDAAVAEGQLAFWLPADMQSFGISAGDVNVTPTTGATWCGGSLPGTRVLHLAWTDAATARSYSADYSIAPIDGVNSLVRHACDNGTASTQVLARRLNASSTKVANGAAATLSVDGKTVTMRISVIGVTGVNGGENIFQVSSLQRTSGNGATSGGGGSTPKTVPPIDCVIAGAGIGISPSTVALGSSGSLKAAVGITLETDGPCGELTANFVGNGGGSAGVPSLILKRVLPSTNPLYEQWAETLDTATTGWGADTFTVTFRNTDVAITGAPTGSLKVTAGCTIDSFAATPYSVGHNGAGKPGDAGKLSDPVTLTVTGASAECQTMGLAITVAVNGGPVLVTNPLLLTGAATRTATLGSSAEKWDAGIYKFTVVNGTSLGTATALNPEESVNVAIGFPSACQINDLNVAPDPANLQLGSGPRPLAAPVVITASQTVPSTCTNLGATIAGAPAGVSPLSLTGSSPSWSATIPASSRIWFAGSYKVKLTSSPTTPIVGQTNRTFVVSAGCNVTAVTVTPASTKQNGSGGSKPLKTPVSITASTAGSCGALTAVIGGPSPGVATVTLAKSGADWTGQINAAAQSWGIGTYPVSIAENGAPNAAWPTGSFNVLAGCGATLAISPASATQDSGGAAGARSLKNPSALNFTASSVANCGTLSAQVTGPSPALGSLSLTTAGAAATGSITNNAAQLWGSGAYTATLNDDGAPITGVSAAFTVNAGCSITAASLLSPSSASLATGPGTSRRLKSNVTVAITKTGTCSALAADIVAVSPSPAPPVASVDLSSGSAVLGGSQLWQAGAYTVTVKEAGVAVTGFPTATLVVSAGCQISNPTSASDALRTGVVGNRPLKNGVTIGYSEVDPSCSALSASIAAVSPAPTPGVTSRALSGGALTLANAAESWGAGTYTITLTDGGTPVAGISSSLVVNGGCTVSLGVPSPTSVALGSGSRLASSVTVPATATGACGTVTLVASGVTNVAGPRTVTSPSVVYAADSDVWSAGTVTLNLQEDGSAISGVTSSSFTITPACTLNLTTLSSSGNANNTNKLVTNVANKDQLQKPMTLTASLSGTCGSITAVFEKKTATSLPTAWASPFSLTTNPAGTAATRSPIGSETIWSTGTYAVKVYNDGILISTSATEGSLTVS